MVRLTKIDPEGRIVGRETYVDELLGIGKGELAANLIHDLLLLSLLIAPDQVDKKNAGSQ